MKYINYNDISMLVLDDCEEYPWNRFYKDVIDN